jgi:AraC-like DNA-binding protein
MVVEDLDSGHKSAILFVCDFERYKKHIVITERIIIYTTFQEDEFFLEQRSIINFSNNIIMQFNDICDKEKHLACCYYQAADNPVAERLTFAKDEKIRRIKSECNLVFVVQGELEFDYASHPTQTAIDNNFFVVPRKIRYNMRFLQPTVLLFFSLNSGIDFCCRLRKQIFNTDVRTVYMHSIVLPANSLLLEHIKLIGTAIATEFLCTKFFQSQIESILNAICAFYPSDMVLQFFSPLVNFSFRDIAVDLFKSTVLQAQDKVFSVQQLAALTNLNVVSFRRQFERIFKMKPLLWITENRKRLIYEELKINAKTLEEIAFMVDISRPNELHRFCKIHFGQTVKDIRKSSTS